MSLVKNQILNNTDRNELEKLIREAEGRTGVQIVMAVIGKSDSYPEIPWMAFAISAAAAGLIVLIRDLLYPVWLDGTTVLITITLVLGAGTFAAMLTLISPGFARLFLTRNRREDEPLRYAGSLFLSHELFASDKRRGVLLLVSRFEKQVVILPDSGLKTLLGDEAAREIISVMTKHLIMNDIRKAFEKGLEQLESMLSASFEDYGRNELPDEIIEEEGL